MKEYEQAAVRVAIKHCKKISKQNALQKIKKWVKYWNDKEIQVNVKDVKKYFKKWLNKNPQYNH